MTTFWRDRTAAWKNCAIWRRKRAEPDQVVDAQRYLGEFTNGHAGAVQRKGRNDGIDAGAVIQSRIHHGGLLVDAATERCDDALDDGAELIRR